jgi:hypothetical protein
MRNGVVLCCDADGSAARPSVLDHVGQGFLAEAVQLFFDLRPQRQTLTGPVDLDHQPFPGAERRRLLGERVLRGSDMQGGGEQ